MNPFPFPSCECAISLQDAVSFPGLSGQLSIADGRMRISAETQPLPPLSLVPGNLFTIYDFAARVEVSEFEPGSDEVPPMVIEASGDVLLGGPGGFLCTLRGRIDAETCALRRLEVVHAGGWTPLSGALGDLFTTPRFYGAVAFDEGGTFLTVSATADWIEPIRLIPGWLEFTGLPPNTAAGPSLSFELVKANRRRFPTAKWEVGLRGGIRIGSGQGALPMILLNGTLRKCGFSELYARTSDEWQPLPGVLPGLRLPIIYGSLRLHHNGLLIGQITHEPLPDLRLGSLLTFSNWVLSVGVRAPPRIPPQAPSGTYRGPGSWMDYYTDPECAVRSLDDPQNETAMPRPSTHPPIRPPPKYGVNVRIRVTGDIVIGGAMDFQVSGTINTLSQNFSILLTHPGGWCPFDFLPFCTPRIFGFFRMSFASSAPVYLHMGAKISLADPINIIPGIVSIRCPSNGCSGGPVFGVAMKQRVKNGPRTLSVFFQGATCLRLTSREYCLNVLVQARAGNRRQLTECVAPTLPQHNTSLLQPSSNPHSQQPVSYAHPSLRCTLLTCASLHLARTLLYLYHSLPPVVAVWALRFAAAQVP